MITTPPRPLLCLLFLALAASVVPVRETAGQTCDSSNTPPVNKKGWAQGAEVPVWIDPNIQGPRHDATWQAFALWNDANQANHSYVHYYLVNDPPPNGTGYVVFDDQIPNDQGGACPPGGCIVRGETLTQKDAQSGQTVSATTTLDSRVTDPEAILEVMSHEIGHPAAFDDCDYCLEEESVMAPPPVGTFSGNYNATGRAPSPTQCDNQGLQQANYPCNRPSNCQNWDATNCVCLAYDTVSNGTSSGEDCIDYYWVEYRSFDGSNWFPTGWVAYAGCFGCKSCNTF